MCAGVPVPVRARFARVRACGIRACARTHIHTYSRFCALPHSALLRGWRKQWGRAYLCPIGRGERGRREAYVLRGATSRGPLETSPPKPNELQTVPEKGARPQGLRRQQYAVFTETGEKTELKIKAPNELQLFPENSGRTATGPEAAAICCVQRNRDRPDAG